MLSSVREIQPGVRIVFIGDALRDVAENLSALRSEIDADVEGKSISGRRSVFDDLSGGFRSLFDVNRRTGHFTRLAVMMFVVKYFVGRDGGAGGKRIDAQRNQIAFTRACRREFVAVNQTELQLCRLLERINRVRIVRHVFARKQDFDGIASDRADHRFTDAEGVHAFADDFDGAGNLALFGFGTFFRFLLQRGTLFLRLGASKRLGFGFRRLRIDAERERNPALQVQTAFHLALRTAQELLQQHIVFLIKIRLAHHLDFREKRLVQVDRLARNSFSGRNVFQRRISRRRLLVGRHAFVAVIPDALIHFLEHAIEGRAVVGYGVIQIFAKRRARKRQHARNGKRHHNRGREEFPKDFGGHGEMTDLLK